MPRTAPTVPEVEVLVSYPAWYFDCIDDTNVLTATIFPADRPQGAY